MARRNAPPEAKSARGRKRRNTILGDAERKAFFAIPCDQASLDSHYLVPSDELGFINQRKEARNAVALAIHLAYLKFPGRPWPHSETPPQPLVEFLASQLKIPAKVMWRYSPVKSVHSRLSAEATRFLEMRPSTTADCARMEDAAREEAQHTNKGTFIVQAILDDLRENRIAFPAVSTIEEAAIAGREAAESEAIEAVIAHITDGQQHRLLTLLEKNKTLDYTPLAWLRSVAEAPSAEALQAIRDRLDYIRGIGLDVESIKSVSPWRFQQLVREGAKVSSHNLSRYGARKVLAVLVAQLSSIETALTDAGGEMYCKLIGDRFSRAQSRQKTAIVRGTKDAKTVARMFSRVAATINSARQHGRDIGRALEQEHDLDAVCSLQPVAEEVATMGDEDTLLLVAQGYSQIRAYAPVFLEMFEFEMSNPQNPLLRAMALLKEMNETGTRKVPEHAPLAFCSQNWRNLITADGEIDRHLYETAVMATVRDRMRSGDLALKGSSVYQPFDRSMVSHEAAARLAPNLGLETDPEAYLSARAEELDAHMQDVFRKLRRGELEGVRYENGKLSISPVVGVSNSDIEAAAAEIGDQMPMYRITELFKRVDAETGVFKCFTNANGRQYHDRDVLMAAVWAMASNLPMEKMAASSPDITYRQLSTATDHFLSEENFQSAIAMLVNLQHELPLAAHWGDGTTTSSDGQFVPAGRRRLGLTSFNPKYSREPGLKLYDTTTDQYAPLYTKVIPASMPEIIHVLDGLVLHKSGLVITEHVMDTGGVSDHIFAVGRLMKTIINPRYRDFVDLKFGIMRPAKAYKHMLPLLGSPINTELITEHFADIVRLGVSLQEGKVLPSQVLRQIIARHQQNQFSKALAEFGRIDRTEFMLRWISDPELRRNVQVMLNKGEMGHILTDTIRVHRQGAILDRTQERQSLRGKAGQFVKAITIWSNTKDGGMIVDGLRSRGREIPDEVLRHISPLGSKHILFTGDYAWRTPWEGTSKDASY